jgi:hypothetical protein
VGNWVGVVAVVLLLLVVVGGWATYTGHVDPGTHTESRTVAAWSPTDEVTHSARVTEPNPIFPTNTTLQNRSAYLTSATPTFRARFAPGYTATASGNVTATVTVSIVRRAVVAEEGPTGDSRTLWQTQRRLQTDRARLQPGERLPTQTTLNATRLAAGTQSLVADLGGTPGEVYTEIRTDVRLSGTVDGRPVETSWTRRLRVSVASGVYRLQPIGSPPSGREWTRSETVANDPGLPRRLGGPAALTLGLVGLALLVVGRRAGAFELAPVEREWRAYRADAAEFDDWVIACEVPSTLTDGVVAETESLSDLVDLAVDAGEAVLREPSGDYLVQYGDVVYRYQPPDPETVRERGGFDLREGLPSVDIPDTDPERPSRADGGDVSTDDTATSDSDDWDEVGSFVGGSPDTPDGSGTSDTSDRSETGDAPGPGHRDDDADTNSDDDADTTPDDDAESP